MNITARADYALRAVIELAARDGLTSSKDLSTTQEIPGPFLESILGELRRAGLVIARRGSRGGYALARDASTIVLAEVIRAVDGPLALVSGLPPESLQYPGASSSLREVWVAVRVSLREILETVSVADVAHGQLPSEVVRLLEREGAWKRR